MKCRHIKLYHEPTDMTWYNYSFKVLIGLYHELVYFTWFVGPTDPTNPGPIRHSGSHKKNRTLSPKTAEPKPELGAVDGNSGYD